MRAHCAISPPIFWNKDESNHWTMVQALLSARRFGDTGHRFHQRANIQRLGQKRQSTQAHAFIAQIGLVVRGDDDDGKIRTRRVERAWTSVPETLGICKSSTRQSGRLKCQEFRNSSPEPKPRAGNPAARSTRTTALRTDSSSSTTAITGHPLH